MGGRSFGYTLILSGTGMSVVHTSRLCLAVSGLVGTDLGHLGPARALGG